MPGAQTCFAGAPSKQMLRTAGAVQHLAFGTSASRTFSIGPRPSLSTASCMLSIAAAADEALSYLTYATARGDALSRVGSGG